METEKKELFTATIEVDLNSEEGEPEMTESELEKFEAEYDVYAAECKAALRRTLTAIDNLSEAINRSGRRNPFDRVEHRLKTFKSVRNKCKDRGYTFDMPSVKQNIKDIAGIRIITKYLDDCFTIRWMLCQVPGINVVNTKDYITKTKENGYSSIHLACQVEIYDPFEGSRLVPVEIQIRSKSMNLWATLEHDLKYKNSNPNPETEERFRRISKILRNFDEEAMALRDYQKNATENHEAMTSAAELNVNVSGSLPL